MPKVPDAVRMFAPEFWGSVDYFGKFYETTYKFKPVDQRAIQGVRGHFDKAIILLELAHKLRPGLAIDQAELEEKGFSPVRNSKELGTVVEAVILELYSTIDCTVKVLRAIHGKTTPRFKESTRGLFQNIAEIDGTIPPEIREAVAAATWFWRLLYLRDELTHLTPGDCNHDTKKDIVSYIHQGVKEDGKPLIIEDIFAWLASTVNSINQFIGLVFHYLSQNFEMKAVFQPCGMVQGRLLHRYIKPEGKITFDSGECGAWVWFEKPDLPTCPFAESCGAYTRKAPPQGWET